LSRGTGSDDDTKAIELIHVPEYEPNNEGDVTEGDTRDAGEESEEEEEEEESEED
jgi:hypothetical protein